MITVTLSHHPASPCAAVQRVSVEVARGADGDLRLTYRIEGEIDALRIPAPVTPARRDGLWRRTCCEAFVMAGDGPDYREFNLSPSGEWQAYAFSDYRLDGESFDIAAPIIEIVCTARTCVVNAHLVDQALPEGERFRLGLSVVIEDRHGGISYWAWRHPPGQPDFHRCGSWLELSPVLSIPPR
jgi:hypothetical protein